MVQNGKIMMHDGWFWITHKYQKEVLGCGKGSVPGTLQTLFHLTKALSWKITKEEFLQVNIRLSLSRWDTQELEPLLICYPKLFAFTPNELGITRIPKHFINPRNALPVHLPGITVILAVREIVWC